MTISLVAHWGKDASIGATSAADTAAAASDSVSATVAYKVLTGAVGDIAAAAQDAVTAFMALKASVGDVVAPASDAAFQKGVDIPAVIEDGITDYMKHTGGPAGISDGPHLGIVFQWTPDDLSGGSGVDQALVFFDGAVPALLIYNADTTYSLILGTSGAVAQVDTAAVPYTDGVHNVIATANGTTASLRVVTPVDTYDGTNTPGSAADLDLTSDLYLFTQDGSTNNLQGQVDRVWINDSYLGAATDNAVSEQFVNSTNGLPRTLNTGISNPKVLHDRSASAQGTNDGSGGDADVVSNSGDGTSPGSYQPAYSIITSASVGDTAAAASDSVSVANGLAASVGDTAAAATSSATASSGAALTPTYLNTYASDTNATSYSDAGHDIGAAASDRIVGCVVTSEMNAAGLTAGVVSATLGGNAMTLANDGTTDAEAVNNTSGAGGAGTYVAVFWLLVPTGATADFAIDFNGIEQQHIRVSFFTINGDAAASVSNVAVDVSTPMSQSLDIPSGGAAIGGVIEPTFTTTSWTAGLTSDHDSYMEFAAYYNVGHSTTPGNGQTISADHGSAMALASFALS